LGVNLAIEGIAHFTNILVPLLKAHPMPSFEQLADAFEEYHARQRLRADAVVSMSGRITRYKAQETWLYKFAAQYVVPLVSDSVKASAYAKSSNNGPWLEYLPLSALMQASPCRESRSWRTMRRDGAFSSFLHWGFWRLR
jgi:hypothetical protein